MVFYLINEIFFFICCWNQVMTASHTMIIWIPLMNEYVKFDVVSINTLRPRQNGCQFPDNNFKCILLNENRSIWIKISLKFVPKGPINNIPAVVEIMAWHRRARHCFSGSPSSWCTELCSCLLHCLCL